jgi:hypothetical protein
MIINAKEKVNAALAAYQDTGDTSAGWNVLRYAKLGLITIDELDFDLIFMEWYPANPDFLILRMAKTGKLYYKNPKKMQKTS